MIDMAVAPKTLLTVCPHSTIGRPHETDSAIVIISFKIILIIIIIRHHARTIGLAHETVSAFVIIKCLFS